MPSSTTLDTRQLPRRLHVDRYEVESAGTEPTEVNQLAIRAIRRRLRIPQLSSSPLGIEGIG